MDYKYIEQLLDRYWRCDTSLEEEQILRTFFKQSNVPASMQQYQPLFVYETQDKEVNTLNEDFDKKILAMIGEENRKPRVVPIHQRLMPLFKAAAIVAIVLTLGNALQVAFQPSEVPVGHVATGIEAQSEGPSVAKADTTKLDSINRTAEQQPMVIIK